jgi:predicted regulator of Ras-like GTPase activity (Roadblock/LC7/MglB family)
MGATSADVVASLGTLKDVAGIMGSFVFTEDGRLVAREIPAMFDDTALSEASGRLTRLRETFAAVGDQLDVAVVRFRDHKLYLKSLGGGMLCIVAEGAVNMPALRMAANLVGRRLVPALERAAHDREVATATASEAASDAAAASASAAAARPALAPPGMRRFRGRPVE